MFRLPMLNHWILGEDGEPQLADLMTWARWLEKNETQRIVLQDYGWRSAARFVSTVFLGLDHGFSLDPDAPPVLWETMIFGGPFDQYQARYTSKLEALRGHQIALSLVEAYHSTPRKTKKALRKFGRRWAWSGPYDPPLTREERRRLFRLFKRIGFLG